MRPRAVLPLVGLLLAATACQAAAPVAGVGPAVAHVRTVAFPSARTATQVIAVPVDSIHSKAAAAALAEDALNLVTFPAGSTRLATRPALGTPDLNQLQSITSLVSRTRWWSVPGLVADATAYFTANPPAGLTIEEPQGGPTIAWTTGAAAAFGLNADLVQDGDHVDVSLGSQVIWTPAKTAIETIPASVTSATLDYDGSGYNYFGLDSRRVVTGATLAQLRAAINPNPTGWIGGRSCPADFGDDATLTMRYSGHAVVFTIATSGCEGIGVTSDGKAQPGLTCCSNGSLVTLVETLGKTPSAPAATSDPLPSGLLTDLTSIKATDAKDLALLAALPLPPGSVTEPTPEGYFASSRNPDLHLVLESRWLSVPLTGAATMAWLTTHLPSGFSVGHIGSSYPAGTEIEEQPRGVYPSSVVLDLNLQGSGATTAMRVDAEKFYLPMRSSVETIPASTTSALLTFAPDVDSKGGVPSRRVDYHGKGLKTLISWLNARPADWNYYSRSCVAHPSPAAKLGVTFHVGTRVVTFYWYGGNCDMNVLVNGKGSQDLSGPPTALIERLLGIRKSA